MQDIAPRGQRGLVGREQHRATALVTFVDDVEQDVGGVSEVVLVLWTGQGAG